MSEKIYLSWQDLEQDTKTLAERVVGILPDLNDIELVCISRGGLFIGGLLSYMLNLKRVHCVSVQSYTDDALDCNAKIQLLTDFLPTAPKDKAYLFVDDVNDTSTTYAFIKEACAARGLMCYFGSTYHKRRDNNLLPDCFGKEQPEDAWLVFPWDNLAK